MTELIVPDWPAPPGVRALVTTRHGGVSRGACASLNLATHVGDDPAAVAENRARLRRRLPAEPLWLNQVHGTAVARAESAPGGATADAAVTAVRRTVCAVMTADCLPVLLCADDASAVGAAHAGWRGLAAGVLEAAVSALGTPPQRLMAWLGPAIGPASFEVGDEVRQVFVRQAPHAAGAFAARGSGKWLADLYELARQRLEAAGLERVYGGAYDTFAQADVFFSYRRAPGAGRMASLVWLED
jgi:YfiH family protein